MVLACIDPRYTFALEQYLLNQLDAQHTYDLFALAGSSLGASLTGTTAANLRPDYTWQEVFFEHLQIAKLLHNIQNVWVFDHLDCGAYKAILGLSSDLDPTIHTTELTKLKGFINTTYPALAFKGFVMDTSGIITKVVDSNNGVYVDNVIIKDFGSSRIRNPASEFTEIVGRESLSYPLKSQIPGVSGTSFGIKTTIHNLCNCSTKTL